MGVGCSPNLPVRESPANPTQDSLGGGKLKRSATVDWAQEMRAFLTLSAMRGVGHKTLWELAEAGRTFSSTVETGPPKEGPSARRLGSGSASVSLSDWRSLRVQASEQAAGLEDLFRERDIKLIFRGNPHFPRSLLDLKRPPHWLFVQGSIPALGAPSIAIVGTRKPSDDGLFLARYVGACLGEWSTATVSGLAAGIDQLAHENSLRAKVPTIAVLGTGILENYPKGSGALRDRILGDGGSIVSEYLPKESYSADNFVQRNRLQAALGRILIPVEWARRSGTAHTVRFATELRRPIACLRLSDWPHDRVALESTLGEETGTVFTIPRQQDAFDRFVRSATADRSTIISEQLSFL